MRSLIQLPVEIATAFLYSASVGIAAGVVAISFSHRLWEGALYGLPGFALAAATFGFLIWRTHRPRRRRILSTVVPAPARLAA